MATFTAIANGNWNAWATWFAGDPGGGEGSQYPGNGDVADCAGFAVTMNLTTTPASGTLAEMKSTGAGYFIWDNTAGGAMTVNCTKFSAGGTGAGTSGVFRFTATTAGYTLTITAGTGAGDGIIGGSGGTNNYGFVKSGTQNFIYTGRITGGSSSSFAVYLNNSSGTVAITGDIYSSTGHGLVMNAVQSLSISCNTIEAAGTGYAMYQIGGTFTATISPLAPATYYTLKGAARSPAIGSNASATMTLVLNTDCFFDESVGTALYGRPPTWTPTPNEMITLGDDKFAVLVAAADLKSGVVNGDVTGTYKGGAGARMKQIGIGVF